MSFWKLNKFFNHLMFSNAAVAFAKARKMKKEHDEKVAKEKGKQITIDKFSIIRLSDNNT